MAAAIWAALPMAPGNAAYTSRGSWAGSVEPYGLPHPPWPDGTWKGAALLGGHSDGSATTADIGQPAELTLSLTMSAGRVSAPGSRWALRRMSESLSGPGGSGSVVMSGAGPLGGDAGNPRLLGTMTVKGSLASGASHQPLNASPSLDGSEGGLTAHWAGCGLVVGDLALALPAQLRGSIGGDGAASAPFVVTTGSSDRPLIDALGGVEGVLSAVPPGASLSGRSMDELRQRVDALYSALGAACSSNGGGPVGQPASDLFPPGRYLAQANGLLKLADLRQLPGKELCGMLLDSTEIGLVGSSAADAPAAAGLMMRFADAFQSAIGSATAAGDTNDLAIVRATASQLGMNEVADAAAKALRTRR